MNASNLKVSTQNLKIMLCGESGTGKSSFASTCPTPGYFFNLGRCELSYKGADFDYEELLTWQDFEKDIVRVAKLQQVEPKYKTIVLDDTTAMSGLAMERAMQISPSKSDVGGPIWNVHYPMVKNLLEGRLRQFYNIPNCNLILLSHVEYDRNENGHVIDAHPMLTGQLAMRIPGDYDEVYYTITKKENGITKWFMQTIPVGFNKGRSRLSTMKGLLPKEIPNTYQDLISALEKVKTQ